MKKIFIFSFLIISLQFNAYSQNTGANAPEAMGFEPVDATDMVNLFTGDFSYVLPLLVVPAPNGGYPLALSYHGGIAENQEASWVGLGWNVNPGALSRNVSGNPDDVKRGEMELIQHTDANSTTYNYADINMIFPNGVTSGASFTWGDYRSVGGYVGYGGFNVGGSIDEYGNASGSVGIGKQFGNLNAGVGIAFSSSSGTDLYASIGTGSVNIKADTKGNLSVTRSGLMSIGVTFNSEGMSYNGPSPITSEHKISTYSNIGHRSSSHGIDLYFVSAGTTTETYWLHKIECDSLYGILYSEDAVSNAWDDAQPEFVGAQSYYSLMDVKSCDYNEGSYQAGDEDIHNNLLLAGYDDYKVTAQGIIGTLSPRIMDKFLLTGTGRVIEDFGENEKINYYSNVKEELNYVNKSAAFNDECKSSQEIDFYFTKLNESYFETMNGEFEYDGNNSNPLEEGFSYNGGNENPNNSLKASKNVQWFTNRDIIYNYEQVWSKGFIEASQISNEIEDYLIYSGPRGENPESGQRTVGRSNGGFPVDGIGGFMITAADGKTYHFSLPVYQYEQIMHNDIDSESYFERRNFNGYAITWLLTAITGPDYIDINNNHRLDDNDYGYWVQFNYGKWADGFIWQLPYNPESNEAYAMGRKQMYYLNSIETASHIALFVKDVRKDGYSKQLDKPLDLTTVSNFKGTQKDGVEFKCQDKVKPLKLDEILLLNKKDYYDIADNSNYIDVISGSFRFVREINSIYGPRRSASTGATSSSSSSTDNVLQPSKRDITINFNSHFEDNIIDIYDLAATGLKEKALRTIKFEYNETNPIGYGENSDYSNKGQLTLSKLNFNGKGGKSFTPPYLFDYYRYSRGDYDCWGFDKEHPENYSLKSIETPIGSIIGVKYESDDYRLESISKEYSQFKLEAKEVLPVYVNNYEGANFKIKIQIPSGMDMDEISTYGDVEISGKVYYNLKWEDDNDPDAHGWGDQETLTMELANGDFEVIEKDVENRIITVSRGQGYWFGGHNNGIPDYWDFDYDIDEVYVSVDECRGGGLRVTEVSLSSGEETETIKTTYNYDILDGSGLSSGVTSYCPYEIYSKRYIPYKHLLPAPGVQYKYVTVCNEGHNGNNETENIYEFNALGKASYSLTGLGFSLGNILTITNPQLKVSDNTDWGTFSSSNNLWNVTARQSVINDNLAAIGRIISITKKNKYDEILSITNYVYEDDFSKFNQGVFSEEFYSLKRHMVWNDKDHSGGTSTWHYTSVNRKEYANVLKEVRTSISNFNSATHYNYDFETGEATELIEINSKGDSYKSIKIPAYHIYSEMGMKSDNINNKNMLSQTTAQINYELNGTNQENPTDWKVLSSSIQTWKGDWNNYVEWDASSDASYTGKDALPDGSDINIWRKHKSFIWKSPLDENGYYTNFDNYDSPEELKDNFPGWTDENYTGTSGNSNGWKLNSEIVRYNHYSTPVEAKDINGDYISSKTDPNHMYTTVSATNSSYISFAASSFEYKKPLNGTGVPYIFEGEIISTLSSPVNLSYDSDNYDANTMITGVMAHTGNYYGVIPSGSVGFKYKATNSSNAVLIRGTDYRASVWVHKNSPGTSYLKANVDGTLTSSQKLVGVYGDWKLYYLDFNVPANTQSFTVYVEASGNEVYVDDFRVSPFEAVVNSYTYDNVGLVTAIINNDNFATKYEYDPAGRLIATYRETPKGFVKTSRHEYRYVGGYGISFDNTLISSTGGSVNFNITNPNNDGLSCETNADWLTLQSQTTNLVVFSAPAYNNCDNYRSCQATITNKVTGESKTYTVRQEGLKISLQEYHHGTNFPSTGDPGDVIMPIVRVLKNGDEPAFSEVEFIFSTDPYGNNPIVTSTEPVVFTSSNYLDISTSLKIPSSYDGHGSHYLIIQTCSGEELPGINTMYIDNPPPYQFTVSVSKSAPGTGHYTLSANPDPSTGPYTYSWNLGQGITTPVVGTPTSKGVECSGYGTFSVTVTYTGTQYASTSATYNGEINSDGVLLLPFD